MTTTDTAVIGVGVGYRYGDRTALDGIDFTVARGACYAFLGPNGSGKSTLFKLLATLLPVQTGDLRVLGVDLRRDPQHLRPRLGVVFQSPAVDRKLSVRRNLDYGGRILGLTGQVLAARIDELLVQTGLSERAADKVENLSGGLRRRVELAKCLLHRPELLLLDEPTSGLDPTARRDLWQLLRSLTGTTILFTTHLLDEAEAADRALILHQGKVVAEGIPYDLARSVGGAALSVEVAATATERAQQVLRERCGVEFVLVDGVLRTQAERAAELVPVVASALGADIRRISVSPPSLLDVFFQKTGAAFVSEPVPVAKPGRRRR